MKIEPGFENEPITLSPAPDLDPTGKSWRAHCGCCTRSWILKLGGPGAYVSCPSCGTMRTPVMEGDLPGVKHNGYDTKEQER